MTSASWWMTKSNYNASNHIATISDVWLFRKSVLFYTTSRTEDKQGNLISSLGLHIQLQWYHIHRFNLWRFRWDYSEWRQSLWRSFKQRWLYYELIVIVVAWILMHMWYKTAWHVSDKLEQDHTSSAPTVSSHYLSGQAPWQGKEERLVNSHRTSAHLTIYFS